jgi:N-acetylglucosamine-6-sulfatase
MNGPSRVIRVASLVLLAVVTVGLLGLAGRAISQRLDGSSEQERTHASHASDSKGAQPKPSGPPKAASRLELAELAKLPNVVVVYTDDQNLRDFTAETMPNAWRLFGDGGTVFDDYVVSTSICCPSRITYLTGRYPHNSGVYSNDGGYADLRRPHQTLPVWLREAGYRTAWVGKWLQGYNAPLEQSAPGFDDWFATNPGTELSPPRFYGYSVGTRRGVRYQGQASRDYHTDVMTRRATKLIERRGSAARPLYMTVNYLAPHHGRGGTGRCWRSVALSPQDRGRFRDAVLPRTPAFNERDVSDKPESVRRAPLGDSQIATLGKHNRCRLASLGAVDRGIRDIEATLRRVGELDRTVLIFTSDNGLPVGEHRLLDKGEPYEASIHMPFAMRVPSRYLGGLEPVRTVPQLAANVDIAPTILDLARARPCHKGRCEALDGRSLLPLLSGDPDAWPVDRGILLEAGEHVSPCGFRGIRTTRDVYIERLAGGAGGGCEIQGEPEQYDLLTDPFELENLASPKVPASDDPVIEARRAELASRLQELRRCVGRSCR